MGKQATEMLKGTLEGIVLAILAVRPAYGYDITSRLREMGFADIAEGTVYALLVRSDLQRSPNAGSPRHRFLTTGHPDEFGELGRRFLGPEVQSVEQFSWVGSPA